MKMDESEEKGGASKAASGKQPSSVDLASKLSENQSEKQVLGKSTRPQIHGFQGQQHVAGQILDGSGPSLYREVGRPGS